MPDYIDKVPIDVKSGNVLILESTHGAVHDGVNYNVTFSGTTSTSMNMMVTTGTAGSGYIHFTASAEANKAFTFNFCEAPTATGGTALTSYNHNRNNTTASPVTVTKNPTVTTIGTTILEAHIVGATNPASKIGGGSSHKIEWLLKPSTKYLLNVVAATATTAVIIAANYYYRT